MIKYQNRIVVKVGTSTLTNDLGKPNLRSFERLARVLSDIKYLGYDVILVSSGAIAIGGDLLNFQPDSLRLKQAAASIGQCRNLFLYDKFFSEFGQTIDQILLSADDITVSEKRENLVKTFDTLLQLGVIPIVNENDSVSYTEIQSTERLFGDNDMLSAVVSVLCHASKLIILSDINGLYDRDPRFHPDAKLIQTIDQFDESLFDVAGGEGSRRGRGGMRTKLQAAQTATRQGCDTYIINGKNPATIYDAIDNQPAGTWFKGMALEN